MARHTRNNNCWNTGKFTMKFRPRSGLWRSIRHGKPFYGVQSRLIATTAMFSGAAQAQTTQANHRNPNCKRSWSRSLIKRTDTETPSPVQIIRPKTSKLPLYDVSDVLRTLSQTARALESRLRQAFAAGGLASHCAFVGVTR